MDRNQAKEFYPILQAFAEGRVIECRTKPSAVKGTSVPNEWTEMKEIEYWNNTEYRIKPEVKFRPFKDAEECWNEMLKHEPFGFTKFKNAKGGYYMVTFIASGVIVGMNNTPFSYENMFDGYTFADGTPFGVKVEE
jgi:hypothetical protein